MVRFHLVVAVVVAVLTTSSGSAERCGVKKERSLDRGMPSNPAAQITIPVVIAPAPTPDPTPAPTPAPAPSPAPTTQNPAIQKVIPASAGAPAPSSPGDDDTPGTVAPSTPAVTPAPASGLPNWVGPLVGKPIDSACYRKTYISKNKQCGAGYSSDNVLTCWTQCPIEYPVECGMECLPQNKDCTKAILKKVTSVVNVALNVATSGVFGQVAKAGKAVQTGVKCGQSLFSVTQRITAMIDEVEKGDASSTKEQILFAVGKSDFVIYDLPAAVATCIGVPIPSGLNKAKQVTEVVQQMVDTVVSSKLSGANLLDFNTFLNVTKSQVPAAAASVVSLSSADSNSLVSLVQSGATCGTDINSVINKATAMVQSLKEKDAATPLDVVKAAVLNSDLILKDLPAAASSCATATKGFKSREAATTGFPSRDQIIKTVHVMIDGITDASSKDDKPVSNADFGISVANMGLDAIALIDPTGIAAMAAEFVQPICGPTAYIGDIDDGPAEQALGLNMIEKAFKDSAGAWAKKGDGQLRITFKSNDDKDVKVNILSGGDKKYEVKVKKGETVEWTKPLEEFQGKTLYLDRWRGGLLGLPGTGGGSLLAWVPSNKDGALTLNVQINPTSFKDKERRERV